MKKLTMSVAALTIAISGFAIGNDSTRTNNNNLVKEIAITTENIIDWVQEDRDQGRMMTQELADIYVKSLLNILSKVEDLNLNK
tara:strand:+ start:494 stop:745 length:252 start_codon:yes stop_codon:yes gene_type:complete